MTTKYVHQMPLKRPNGDKIYQHIPLQDLPNFSQIGIFGFENMPSGNPGLLCLLHANLIYWDEFYFLN
jgi:hypothetical protein